MSVHHFLYGVRKADILLLEVLARYESTVGENEILKSVKGDTLVTWKLSAGRKTVDTALLKADGLYEKYCKVSEGSRRFLLK